MKAARADAAQLDVACATTAGSGRRCAAVRAVVAAEVAEVDGARRRRRGRSGGSAWSPTRAGARRSASASSSTPKYDAARASRPRSATSGSSALSTSAVPAGSAGDDRGPAVGDRLQLAVAVELVAEQVRRAASRAARARSTTGPSQNSSTSNRPRSPSSSRPPRRAAPASAEATPPAMFAPARLWTSRRAGALEDRRRPSPPSSSCRWWPRSRRCRARSRAGEQRRSRAAPARVSTLPGSDVPPPRPARARERADRLGGRHLRRPAALTATSTRSAPGSDADGGRAARRSGRRRRRRVNGRSAWKVTSRAAHERRRRARRRACR